MKQLTKTNKSILYLHDDGIVEKRYFTTNAEERVRKDQESITYIRDRFGINKVRDWSLEMIDLYWISIDKKAIGIEYIQGQNIATLDGDEQLLAEELSGKWLALYHNKIITDDINGLIYSDLNMYNIIMDKNNMRIVVIDPGMRWGVTGHVYEDIVQHINSIISLCVQTRKNPISLIKEFIKGYASESKNIAQLKILDCFKAYIKESKRKIISIKENKFKKIMFLISSISILPIIVVYIPLKMKTYA